MVSLHYQQPWFSQSNGEAERAVKTMKSLLKKAEDPYMAILTYWLTPLSSGFGPAELLMSCHLHVNLPIIQSQLQPSVPDFLLLKERRRTRRVFDSQHAVYDLDTLFPWDEVRVPNHNITSHVIEAIVPRSYHVSIPTGIVRHNRAHLQHLPISDNGETFIQIAKLFSCVNLQLSNCYWRVTMVKSGHVSMPPKWWIAQIAYEGEVWWWTLIRVNR